MPVLTAEAMVAAPIWAFFHIRMDGADFVDQVQRPGYMIAFNLLLRIPLALFGLFLSYHVFEAMAYFVDVTFDAAMIGATADYGVGVVGTVVMIVILAYLHYQLAVRSFSLITRIPDRVMRWFGQGSEALGEEQDNDQSVAFIVGHSTRGAHQTMEGVGRMAPGVAAGLGGAKSVSQGNRAAEAAKGVNDPGGGKKTPGDGRAKRARASEE